MQYLDDHGIAGRVGIINSLNNNRMSNLSQTQLANFAALGGLIVLVLNQFGVVLDQSQVIFALAAVWSVGSIAYNYYQRFQKGDLNVLGSRK